MVNVVIHTVCVFGDQSVIDVSYLNPFLPISEHANLLQVVEGILSSGVHRVPVVSDENRLVGRVPHAHRGANLFCGSVW